MVDTFSVQKRKQIMQLIRGKNTTPELKVRSYLHKNGLRFRIHNKNLPGNPDIVLRKYKTVVFVHGCFWHQHNLTSCKRSSLPKSNQEYWLPKLKKNVDRDANNQKILKELGWNVETIWECQVNNKGLLKLLRGITCNV